MSANPKKGREWILSLALATGLHLLPPSIFAFQQNDPFYVRLFEKAQKSFLAQNYRDAAQDFEIAAFGLNQDLALRAKAYFFIGLCYSHLQDISKSESFVRQGMELLADKSLSALQMPESVLPDLEKLLAFFDIQVAKPAPPSDAAAPQIREVQGLPDPSGSSSKEAEQDKKPGEKAPVTQAQKEQASATAVSLGSLKEGDLVDLILVDKLPVAIRRVQAVYPSSSRAARTEGTVTVNALISEEGGVVKTEIIQGMKGAGFDQAAAQAVRRWKFEPATIKGIKVRVWMPINIVFKAQ